MRYLEKENLFAFSIIGPETDIHDRLHFHSLFAMLQEAACLDVDHHGFGADKMDALEACWLVLRMRVVMHRIPKWKDTIYIKTWSSGYQRVFFNRDFDIFDSDMNKIGEATSVWLIAHQGDHRPVRPQTIEGMEMYECVTPSERNAPKLKPVSLTESDTSPLLKKYADFSDIDRNMHVNNTRYVAWSLDAFYKDLPHDHEVKELTINYSSEVKPGEEISIYRTQSEDRVQIDGYETNTGRHVFTTEILL
ncbi:MAG: hypothetical protein IKG93_10455 [Clostridiales bacterium]|nr:hypothetical protein [Clostridiales bacterium]